MTGLFTRYQPVYAAHRITAFPVSTDTKRPLVSNYLKMGIPATSALARRFTDANALGIAAGKPNRITVLDIDTTNERVLADALTRHGEPRVIVRTASGKFHAYYRHNGEPRKIRPWKSLPIDLLGGGFVVAAPSLYGKGRYEIIKGTLDDLATLTTMRALTISGRCIQTHRYAGCESMTGAITPCSWLWAPSPAMCIRPAAHKPSYWTSPGSITPSARNP